MLDFIRLQYQMSIITRAHVEQFASQGWITAEEAAQILGDA